MMLKYLWMCSWQTPRWSCSIESAYVHFCIQQSVLSPLIQRNHYNNKTHSVHQRGVLLPPSFSLLQALPLPISDPWPWDAALLSLDVCVYLLYLCLCTDFTGFVCIFTLQSGILKESCQTDFSLRNPWLLWTLFGFFLCPYCHGPPPAFFLFVSSNMHISASLFLPECCLCCWMLTLIPA